MWHKHGKFGAYMQVHIQNDGPVTIELESPASGPATSDPKQVSDPGTRHRALSSSSPGGGDEDSEGPCAKCWPSLSLCLAILGKKAVLWQKPMAQMVLHSALETQELCRRRSLYPDGSQMPADEGMQGEAILHGGIGGQPAQHGVKTGFVVVGIRPQWLSRWRRMPSTEENNVGGTFACMGLGDVGKQRVLIDKDLRAVDALWINFLASLQLMGSWDLPVFLGLLCLICGQALLVSTLVIIATMLVAGTDGALGVLGLLPVLYCVVALTLHPSHLLFFSCSLTEQIESSSLTPT
ncbi:hypothetical protein MC885_015568 [Smutsia gigantea]|nr:hypothetical protein MC885_015568 [Smutsia gigantea]